MRTHAVENAKINYLGMTTLLGRDFSRSNPISFSRRHGVNVISRVVKDPDQRLIARQSSRQAQFKLGVVGIDQDPTGRSDKSPLDLSPLLGSSGDILHIGITRRQAPGRRDALAKGRMNPPVRSNQLGQGIGIAGLELSQLPILDDQIDDRVCRPQFSQLLSPGRVAPSLIFASCRLQGQLGK